MVVGRLVAVDETRRKRLGEIDLRKEAEKLGLGEREERSPSRGRGASRAATVAGEVEREGFRFPPSVGIWKREGGDLVWMWLGCGCGGVL